MKTDDIERELQRIQTAAESGDEASAQEMEGALFVSVLEAIRSGADHPRTLATTALRSLDIPFHRGPFA